VSSGLPVVPDGDERNDIAGALAEFVHALRTGVEPMGVAHDNVMSLAMVEAAVQSAATGRRVLLADLLREAFVAAGNSENALARAELSARTTVADLLAHRALPPSPAAEAASLR
jgi:hypothetical protein